MFGVRFVALDSYVRAANELQASYTGEQHRLGVFIVPLAVPKVFAVGDLAEESEVIDVVKQDDGEALAAKKAARGTGSIKYRKSSATRKKGKVPRKSAKPCSSLDGDDAPAVTFEEGENSDDEPPKSFSFDWDAYKEVWGDTPYEDAVTAMFSEYAVLYSRVAGWKTSIAPHPHDDEGGKEAVRGRSPLH